MGPLIIILAGAAACGAPRDASETKNVFGPDNRETADVTQLPYSAVGRLDAGCTGTLVGKRLVLTAAHCVIDAATGTMRKEMTYFRPALTAGRSAEPTWVDYAWIGSLKPEDERAHDWAVLRLEKDVDARYGHLAVHEVDFAASLPYTTSLVGYSSDRSNGDVPSVHRGCYVMEVSEGRLFHDCDATAGVSGGPLVTSISGVSHIVGVTVSEFRRGAPSSVTRDAYSKDYANVAVPASAFAQVVRTLVQTADAGIAAPQIAGVVERTNPNARVSPDGDGSGGGGFDAAHVRAPQEIGANYRYIEGPMRAIQRDLHAIASMADAYGALRLRADAQAALGAAESLDRVLFYVSTRDAGNEVAERIAGDHAILAERFEAVKRFDEWRNASAQRQAQLEQRRASVQGALRQVQSLVFK